MMQDTDVAYTNQIDVDSQYRFRDAANLIRANTAIIDKASYDLFQRYPDLASEMPRNLVEVEMEHYVVRLTYY